MTTPCPNCNAPLLTVASYPDDPDAAPVEFQWCLACGYESASVWQPIALGETERVTPVVEAEAQS